MRVGRTGAIVTLLMLIGAGLRLFRLDESFWLDEVLTMDYARRSPAQLLMTAWPPLYRVLMHFWLNAAGTGEAIARTPSALASIASIPLMYAAGRRLLDRRDAIIATIFLTLSAHQIYYAQEARYYGLLLLFLLLSFYGYLRVREGAGSRWVAAHTLASLAAVETHYFAVLSLGAQLVHSVLHRRRGPAATAAIGPAVAILAFGGRLTLFRLFEEGGARDPMEWIPPAGMAKLFAVPALLMGWGNGTFAVGGALLLLLAATVVAFRTRPAEREREALSLLWLSLLLPLLVPFLVSLLYRPMFIARYLIGASPALYLLAAWTLDRLRPMALSVAAVALCLGLSVHGIVRYYSTPQKPQWRDAALLLDREARAGDLIWVGSTPHTQALGWYYRGPAVRCPLRESGVASDAKPACHGDWRRLWVITIDGFSRETIRRRFDSMEPRPVRRRLLRLNGLTLTELERPGPSGNDG